MARLGIVIAVSDNLPPFKSLKACARDGEAFAAILKQTGRFDEILNLSTREETASRAVKSAITALVNRYKGQAVEEIVFYFSGHGEFAGNEFYHILSDYGPASRNQTALTNSELDGLIRGLAPTLFAKVVDACYSGTSYIKSEEELGDYLKSSQVGFKEVYFLYSSQGDERSWTAGELSAFTKSLLVAIGRDVDGSIRYRDLISAASDFFESQGGQTPHFVTQADFTATFCDASPQMKALVETFVPVPAPAPTPASPATPPKKQPSKSLSLAERVRQVEKGYSTRQQATEALEGLGKILENCSPGPELDELYSIAASRSDEVPDGTAAVGEWLAARTSNEFFAVPTYRTEAYKKRVPKKRSGLSTFSRMMAYPNEETELVDATRRVVSGYRVTAAIPFDAITIRLEPKSLALTPEECLVVVVASRSEVQIFWTLRHFHYSDWDTAVPDPTVFQWSNVGVAIRDDAAIAEIGTRVIQEFIDATRRRVAARWPESATAEAGTALGTAPGFKLLPNGG